jgi:starch synthase
MRICFITSELAPLVKVGGLADVSGALPRELAARGHDVRVYLPFYRRVRESHPGLTFTPGRKGELTLGNRTYRFGLVTTRLPGSDLEVQLVDCPALFDRAGVYTQDDDEHLRFVLLTRAAIEACQATQWAPAILHCNDWQTALGPLYLKTAYAWDRLFEHTRTILTIHNLGYQGMFHASPADLGLMEWAGLLHPDDLRAGRVGFLKTGLTYADALTTVSPTYAREIQAPALGMGLDDLLRRRASVLTGILNGVDTAEWDPRIDRRLAARYSEKSLHRKEKNKEALLTALGLPYTKGVPVLGIVSRLSAQKGIELLDPVVPELLAARDVRFVALGNGEPRLEQLLHAIQSRFPERACFYRGFSDELAHRIEAGADLFLMPSLYEPCGLNQMYSMRYGTAPVVHATGGLADTVQHFDPATGAGNGFRFEHPTHEGLRWALGRGLAAYDEPKAWRRLQKNGMMTDFSWGERAAQYEELYQRVADHVEVPR